MHSFAPNAEARALAVRTKREERSAAVSVVGEQIDRIGHWPGRENIRTFIAGAFDCERHLFSGFQHEHQGFAGVEIVPGTFASPPQRALSALAFTILENLNVIINRAEVFVSVPKFSQAR